MFCFLSHFTFISINHWANFQETNDFRSEPDCVRGTKLLNILELKSNWIPTIVLISVHGELSQFNDWMPCVTNLTENFHHNPIQNSGISCISFSILRVSWEQFNVEIAAMTKAKPMSASTNENGFSQRIRDQHIEWKLIGAPYVSNCINFPFIRSLCISSSHSAISLDCFLSHVTFFVCLCAFLLPVALWHHGHHRNQTKNVFFYFEYGRVADD